MAEETLGRSVLELSTDQKELDTGIDRAKKKAEGLDKKFQDIAKSVQRAGRAMSTFLTLPILGATAAMVKAASDAEETRAKFRTVFADQADAVEQWAETYAKQVNRGRTETIGFLATVQDLFVPLGASREAAAEFAKTVVSLSTDIGSFNNLPTTDVLRDIQSTLVGNHETTRKYGVIINEARLNQELFNMGIAGGKDAASELEKAQARLNLVLQGTTDAQGDAERTADSFANQLRGLKSSATDLAEAFGTLLLPPLAELVGKAKAFADRIADLDESKKRIIIRIGLVAASLGPLALGIAAVTKAVIALRTAMIFLAGNPITLLIGAIVAVTASIATLLIRTKEQTEAQKDLTEEFEDANTALERNAELSKDLANINETLGGEKNRLIITIAKEKEKLAELRTERKLDFDAISAQLRVIAELESRLHALTETEDENEDETEDLAQKHIDLAAHMADVRRELQLLYPAWKQATDVIAEAKEETSDYYSVVSQMVGALGDLWANLGERMGASEERLFRIRKTFALGQAIVNTAQAVTLALATTGPIGAALAAAAGALQVGAILAQPVPSYAAGGFAPSPELAVVGDAPGGEWILNQRQMAQLRGGGMTVVQHIYGHVWSDRALRNMARSATGATRY